MTEAEHSSVMELQILTSFINISHLKYSVHVNVNKSFSELNVTLQITCQRRHIQLHEASPQNSSEKKKAYKFLDTIRMTPSLRYSMSMC
jgi:hypothetical protein